MNEQSKWTDADFGEMSWHDCRIHSVGLDQDGEWQSDLVLHIDFIVEWLCGIEKTCRFRVAPAILRFANVDDVRFEVSLKFKQPIEIYSVERSALPDKGSEYYRWRILIQNYPGVKENMIEFDATGFAQELIGNPIETDAQSLTRAEREQSLRDWRTTP